MLRNASDSVKSGGGLFNVYIDFAARGLVSLRARRARFLSGLMLFDFMLIAIAVIPSLVIG